MRILPLLAVTMALCIAAQLPAAAYVNFTAHGLPAGMTFLVAFDNTTKAAAGSNLTISFSVASSYSGPYGVDAYVVNRGERYNPNPMVGLAAAGESLVINFTEATYPSFYNTTNFTESGLPKGATFFVVYGNLTEADYGITGTSANLTFLTPPGNYTFAADTYLPSTTSSSVKYGPSPSTGKLPSGSTQHITYTESVSQSSTTTTTIPTTTAQQSGTSASGASIYKYLSDYMSSGIIANSVFTNITVAGDTYSLVQVNASSQLILNITRTPSLITNSSTAFAVLYPYLTAKYYPNSTIIASLNSTLREYRSSGQGNINDCLTETGMQSGGICLPGANITACLQRTCQTIPVCTEVLNNFGVPSPFASGVLNFSADYYEMNNTFNSYFSLLSGINRVNYGSTIKQLQAYTQNISSYTSALNENPLFPAPANITPDEIGTQCGAYSGFGGPWYCYAVGFCYAPGYNSTALSDLTSELGSLLSSPITNSSIQSVADSDATTALSFYAPTVLKKNEAALSSFLNSTKSQYTSVLDNLTLLTSRYSNSTASTALAELTSEYASINAAGPDQNITTAQKALSSAIQNASAVYSTVSRQYQPVYQLAYNTTGLIILKELNFKNPPSALVSLGVKDGELDTQLQSQLNTTQLRSLNSQLLAVNSQAKEYSQPPSSTALLKSLYGGLLAAMLSNPKSLIQSDDAAAPLYTAVISLLLGLVVLLVIYYLTYVRLMKAKKLKVNPRVARAWRTLFVIIFLIVIVYTVVTYFVASTANGFLPAQQFTGYVYSGKVLYLLVNSSYSLNSSLAQCASALKASLAQKGVVLRTANFTSSYNSCSINSSVTGSQCFSRVFGSYSPVVAVDNLTSDTLAYSGMYGKILYADGASVEGASCPLASVIGAG